MGTVLDVLPEPYQALRSPEGSGTGISNRIHRLQPSTTVVIFPAYGHLRHHGSEIMDDGRFGRGDAGAVGVVVAQRQGADQALVPAGPHGRLGRAVPRRPARAGAAQDRMDASGSRR